VFRAGDDSARSHEIGVADAPLQAIDNAIAIGGNDVGILGEAFIGATPSIILWNRQRWGERPVMPGDAEFQCGDPCDLLDQVWIIRGAEPDIVRKDDRPAQVRVTVDSINAPNDWDRDVDAFRIY